MTAPVTWNRIEPTVDAGSVDAGLAAPLADPLWLLGRQWQVGELTAEDAGTPIAATIESTAFPIDRLVVGDHVRALDARLPLEAHVEAEPPAPPDLRMRLTAGRDLAAALAAAGRPAAAAALPSFARPAAETDRAGAALLRALGAQAIDGELVAAALAARSPNDVAAALEPHADAAALATLATALSRWLASYLQRTGRAAPTAWSDEHAAYRFSLRAAVGTTDVVLEAPAYRGGTLDWSDFEARVEPRGPGTAPAAIASKEIVLPSPLEFTGGPARRFFELERGGASYGALAGAPPDVATALLVELTLVFGGDWFVAPVQMPVGALGRIDRITVTDTFGGAPTVLAGRIRSPGWRMFECGDAPAVADLLAIVPTVAAALEGPAIEAVGLGRDEAANLVWAIEDVVADPLGLPRTVEHARPGVVLEEAYRYVPFIAPPSSWFPLVRRGADPTARFVGATIRGVASADAPRGRLLTGWPHVGFLAADVPADGLRIERRWQLAVAADGTRALWLTRSDRVGRGPATSGVAADQLIGPT